MPGIFHSELYLLLGFGTIKLLRVNLKKIEKLAPWIVLWGFPAEQESCLTRNSSLIFDEAHKHLFLHADN